MLQIFHGIYQTEGEITLGPIRLLVERLRTEVQQSQETLTCSEKPGFPIYICLPVVKLEIKFEHLKAEVAWSYWLNFFLKIGVAETK